MRVVYNPKTMTYRTILNKSKFQVKEEWNLSGTIEQCIIRYASKLDEAVSKRTARERIKESKAERSLSILSALDLFVNRFYY